jgi:hypothetical protein
MTRLNNQTTNQANDLQSQQTKQNKTKQNKTKHSHKTLCTNNTTKQQKDLPMVEALVHHAEQGSDPPVV